MITPLQLSNIRDGQALDRIGGVQQAQQARQPGKAGGQKPQEPGIQSPLEGISGSAKANAYLYWPKDKQGQAAAGDGSVSPMKRMRLWSQAVSNVLTGNAEYDDSALPANLALAARNGKGALAGQPIRQLTDDASAIMGKGGAGKAEDEGPSTGCETCASRKYKDDSSDAGVSFQSAKSVPASTAGILVASHEGEHVTRETADAQQNGDTITNKKVTFQYGCCPECNKMYIKGGLTSITKRSSGEGNAVAAKMADIMGGVGEKLNAST